jgi:negative regulator of sigma E activity
MNEERQNERDSQLSAMFDGELSAAECELLARRLTRDEALRAQWSRYALMGAALRAERGVKLHDRVARRVQVQVALETAYGDVASVDANPARPTAARPARAESGLADRWMRVARPVFGAGIAAGVAAMSILWLRGQETPETLLAANPDTVQYSPEPAVSPVALQDSPAVANTRVAAREPMDNIVGNGEPFRYSTPAPSSQRSIAPPARLANYVVAHSEYSGPLARRLALLGLVASDGTTDGTIPEDDAASGTETGSDAR